MRVIADPWLSARARQTLRELHVHAAGLALVVVSIVLSRPAPEYDPSWNGPTHVHYGAFVWVAGMWLHWIGRTWAAPLPNELNEPPAGSELESRPPD